MLLICAPSVTDCHRVRLAVHTCHLHTGYLTHDGVGGTCCGTMCKCTFAMNANGIASMRVTLVRDTAYIGQSFLVMAFFNQKQMQSVCSQFSYVCRMWIVTYRMCIYTTLSTGRVTYSRGHAPRPKVCGVHEHHLKLQVNIVLRTRATFAAAPST